MAALITLEGESCPVLVPHPAVVQGGEGHHGFSVSGIPAVAPVFHSVGRRLAFRFRRPGNDLPVVLNELRVTDHLLPLRYVLRQLIRGAAVRKLEAF